MTFYLYKARRLEFEKRRIKFFAEGVDGGTNHTLFSKRNNNCISHRIHLLWDIRADSLVSFLFQDSQFKSTSDLAMPPQPSDRIAQPLDLTLPV